MLCLSPFNRNNVDAGVTATVLDITDRNRAEKALRESEQKFRLIAENADDVIWQTDLHLKPMYVSRSILRLCGYTPEEMMEKTLEEMLVPDSRDLSVRLNAE